MSSNGNWMKPTRRVVQSYSLKPTELHIVFRFEKILRKRFCSQNEADLLILETGNDRIRISGFRFRLPTYRMSDWMQWQMAMEFAELIYNECVTIWFGSRETANPMASRHELAHNEVVRLQRHILHNSMQTLESIIVLAFPLVIWNNNFF